MGERRLDALLRGVLRRRCKRYLKDDGLLVQWMQAYEIDVGLLSTIFKALGKHFGDYVVYRTGAGDLLVVATPGGQAAAAAPASSSPSRRGGGPRATSATRASATSRRCASAGARRSSRSSRDAGYPANSDYFPILDQRAPRSRFKRESARTPSPDMREADVPVLADARRRYAHAAGARRSASA